jgi:hypothetical protein
MISSALNAALQTFKACEHDMEYFQFDFGCSCGSTRTAVSACRKGDTILLTAKVNGQEIRVPRPDED